MLADIPGTPLVLEAWRAVILGIGAFDIGLACYLGWSYFRQHLFPGRPYNARSHVLAIIGSYVLLLGGLEGFILGRAIQRAPITWRLPLATVAFPLGAYALLVLVHARAKRPAGDG
jgi:hypothetical protein